MGLIFDLPKVPVVSVADVHGIEDAVGTVVLGDCLELMRRLPDACIDLIVTSPPYNKSAAMSNNGKWRNCKLCGGGV